MMYRLTAALMLLSSPALAHSGPHLHPHGSDNWWAVALGAFLIFAALGVMAKGWRR